MDLVFNLHGSITYLDVSIVAPFSCNPSLVSGCQHKTRALWPREAEKTKFDRYPHINLVPFILRPGPHARKFFNFLLRDADNPPIAVRDTWSAIQECSPQCHLQTTTHGSRYVTLGVFVTPHLLYTYGTYGCLYRIPGNAHSLFQSQDRCSSAMWPCCDITSSDDDEHDTGQQFPSLV